MGTAIYKTRWGTGSELYDGSDQSQIALTFDDGPNDPHTLRLLDILAKYGTLATFFMIGKHVRLRPDLVRAVHAAGHVIGNHTYSHPNLSTLTREQAEYELAECQKIIEDVIGVRPIYFRPPYGASSAAVEISAKALGLTSVIWSIIPEDWNATSVGLIVRRVCRDIDARAQGEIILLHDGAPEFGSDRGRTVSAARAIIARYATSGKQFVSLREFTLSS